MKKRTKILSILLALMLTATLVPTALVQVFASDYEWEDTASPDEPKYVPELTLIEITKAPDNTTVERNYNNGQDYVWADDLMYGLEMLLTFDDGTTYNYSYDEDFDTPQCFYENGIAEKYDYDIDIIDLKINEADEDGFINNLPLGETEITYQLLGCTATQKITVLENEYVLNPITKLELTKLPDKEFSAPYVTGDHSKENESNSIAYNMKGAEITLYRKNGEKEVIAFSKGIYNGYDDDGNAFSPYVYWVDPNADPIQSSVKDLGNYRATVRFLGITDLTLEFSVKNTGTGDNPATPGEVITPSNPSSTVPTSSQGGTSSTSDTTTKDTVSSNNTSNGAVATGNVAISAILLSVLLLAAGVMAVIGRKKQLF